MNYFICFFLFLSCTTHAWSPSSWQYVGQKYQLPDYKNKKELAEVKQKLLNCAPLVFAGECRELKNKLIDASVGKSFVLMGGDCAETFQDFSVNKIKNDFRLMLQMALVLTYASSIPIVKIGRVAGQFAKPRSELTEIIRNRTVQTYRGDIINSFDMNYREPEPLRLLQAYYQSAQTLNLLRAFATGGYADITSIKNFEFPKNNLVKELEKAINFNKAIGIDMSSPRMRTTSYYTAHEALALDYEEPLTRNDSITGDYYDCSAHMLWVGERTRQSNSSHIEFLKGIANPIGIKISSDYDENEILSILEQLNPNNEHGKISIITRMGAENLLKKLPDLITLIEKNKKNVVWICDPMHANTIKVSGIKTRPIEKIKEEIDIFFRIHKLMKTIPGGIHLELTSSDVTECLSQLVTSNDLNNNYLSLCDPRLNGDQAFEIALFIADRIN